MYLQLTFPKELLSNKSSEQSYDEVQSHDEVSEREPLSPVDGVALRDNISDNIQSY
jgi:hypothetical protein